jgi:hypothetical protein
MRNIYLLFSLLFVTAVYSQNESKRIHNDKYKFSFEIPEGWEIQTDTTSYTLYNPYAEDTSNVEYILIAMFNNKKPGAFEQRFSAGLEFLIANTPNYTQVETGKFDNPSGMENRWVIYNTHEYYQTLYIKLASGTFVYSIDCYAKIQNFDKFKPLFEKFCNSIKPE